MDEMIKLMQEVAGHGNADIKRGIDIDYEAFASRARGIIHCKPDEHDFQVIVVYETPEVPTCVAVEWCTKCGIIHENVRDEDGVFVAPFKSHIPTG